MWGLTSLGFDFNLLLALAEKEGLESVGLVSLWVTFGTEVAGIACIIQPENSLLARTGSLAAPGRDE